MIDTTGLVLIIIVSTLLVVPMYLFHLYNKKQMRASMKKENVRYTKFGVTFLGIAACIMLLPAAFTVYIFPESWLAKIMESDGGRGKYILVVGVIFVGLEKLFKHMGMHIIIKGEKPQE